MGLRELGYVERQNIAFAFHSAHEDAARLRDLADDPVRRQVNVIVTVLTQAALLVEQPTQFTLIVKQRSYEAPRH